VRFSERSAENPEVVRVDENFSPVDASPSRDDSVGVRSFVLYSEPHGTVPPERSDLVERVFIEQEVDPLPYGQFPKRALAFCGSGVSCHDGGPDRCKVVHEFLKIRFRTH